jgi:threonine/homoserine/homoserine lactone efflux protein
MTLPDLFFTSAGFGLAVAAPVGPMAILCMRRTLARGWKHGMATGLGIAAGDAIYAAVAALGLVSISAFVFAHERLLHAGAGLFLLYLALKTLRANDPAAGDARPSRLLQSWPAAFASAILLTLTNPPTILMFAAIFAALAPTSGFDAATAFATVAGVFSGSLLWWCGLAAAVSSFRSAIGPRPRLWISRVAGLTLAVFGVLELRKSV